MKYIEVKNCLECPKVKTCKEWKKLTPTQKFMVKTVVGVEPMLQTCPLPDIPIQEVE